MLRSGIRPMVVHTEGTKPSPIAHTVAVAETMLDA